MIPKKIHFIWLGKNEIPTSSKSYIKKWSEIYDDYEISVWNDEMVYNCNLVPDFLNEIYYNSKLNVVFKCDILRYLIINKYGGLYFDVDFECIKKIPEHFLNFNFLGGIQNNGEVAIGFLAAKPNTLILNETIKSIPNSINYAKENNFYFNENIHKITGPEFFNKITIKYFSNQDYFFFTKEYFYPYWFKEFERRIENFQITSPLSYAVHHWQASWKN